MNLRERLAHVDTRTEAATVIHDSGDAAHVEHLVDTLRLAAPGTRGALVWALSAFDNGETLGLLVDLLADPSYGTRQQALALIERDATTDAHVEQCRAAIRQVLAKGVRHSEVLGLADALGLPPPPGETEFRSMDALVAEVARREAEGHDITKADDVKYRVLGSFDRPAEACLTSARGHCNAADSPKPGAPPDGDDTLVKLWSDNITLDVEAAFVEQTEADRAAAADMSLPTEAEMKARVAAIEAGIREAGMDWRVRTFPASPFTFRWGTHNSQKNHDAISVRTDVSGVTVLVGFSAGVTLDGRHHAARLTWADGDGVLTEWVAEQVREAVPKYEALPMCRCSYHRDRQAGRIK